MLSFQHNVGAEVPLLSALSLKGTAEDFLVREVSIDGSRAGSGACDRSLPVLESSSIILVHHEPSDEQVEEEGGAQSGEESLLGNEQLQANLLSMSESTLRFVCSPANHLESLPEDLAIPLSPGSPKAERAAIHRFVHEKFLFLQTRFDVPSGCIVVSPNTVLRPLSIAGLGSADVVQLMHLLRAGPSHPDAAAGVDVGRGLERQVRTAVYVALASACASLEGRTVDDRSKGKSWIQIKFRSRAQKRSIAKQAIKATCFLHFELGKRHWDHTRLTAHLNQSLALPTGALCYAGLKDKCAVTWQFATITLSVSVPIGNDRPPRTEAEDAAREALRHKFSSLCKRLLNLSSGTLPLPSTPSANTQGLVVCNLRTVDAPLRTGQLRGNHFDVVLRGVTVHAAQALRNRALLLLSRGFPNFYGAQRLGLASELAEAGAAAGAGPGVEQGSATTPPGATIGELLLRGRYKAAALAILHANNRTEASPYRSALNEGRSFAEVLSVIPVGRAGMDRERALVQALIRFGCDQEHNEGAGCDQEQNERFRLALKSALPFSMRLLWVNTFQSWLWNAAASARIALGDGPLAGDLVHEGDTPFTEVDVEDDGEAAGGPDADANATSTTVRLVTEAELASLTQEGKDALARRVVIPLFGTKVQHAQHASGREYQLQLLAAGLPDGQTQAQASTTVKSRILHAMPKGAYRRVFQWPGEFSMTEDLALETLSLSFSLPAGSYATSFIRELAACRKLL